DVDLNQLFEKLKAKLPLPETCARDWGKLASAWQFIQAIIRFLAAPASILNPLGCIRRGPDSRVFFFGCTGRRVLAASFRCEVSDQAKNAKTKPICALYSTNVH